MGRPAKGERIHHGTRLPLEHYDIYMEAGRLAGMTFNDYLAFTLARVHGLEMPFSPSKALTGRRPNTRRTHRPRPTLTRVAKAAAAATRGYFEISEVQMPPNPPIADYEGYEADYADYLGYETEEAV